MYQSPSWLAGITVGKQLNDWLIIQSGLQYKQYDVDMFVSRAFLVNSFQALSSRFNETPEAKERYGLNYLRLPLTVGVQTQWKDLSLSVNGGIVSEMLVGNGQLVAGHSFKVDPIYFSTLVSVDLAYHFADNYSINLSPSYSRAITKMATYEGTTDLTPSQSQVSIGLKYHVN